MKQPEAALGLLKMAKIEQPKYQYEGADVYVAEEISPGVSLHITVSGSNVIVAPGEDALKAALANFAKTDAAGGVSETIVNRGSFGFVMLDGAKAKDLPIDKDLSKVNLAATLGTDNEWREFVITSPAGFDGIASTLESVM
jgi:hypothetical protein